jgi:hypothetical protein
VIRPEIYPPLTNNPALDDYNELMARLADDRLSATQYAAATRRLATLIRQHERSSSNSLPARGTEARSASELHRLECGAHLEETDFDYWCSRCGFEQPKANTRRRPRTVYQVVRPTRYRSLQSDELETVDVLSETFERRVDAATHVRIARDTLNDHDLRIRRRFLIPAARTAKRPKTANL